MPPPSLELVHRADALALEAVERHGPQAETKASLDDRITAALADDNREIPVSELRGICHIRSASLYERLAALTAAGRIVKSSHGYRLTER
jgi:hypothetical protein